ncbi:MAG: hypothetical protein ACRD1R_11070 [Acidobacteriota bacterium]
MSWSRRLHLMKLMKGQVQSWYSYWRAQRPQKAEAEIVPVKAEEVIQVNAEALALKRKRYLEERDLERQLQGKKVAMIRKAK